MKKRTVFPVRLRQLIDSAKITQKQLAEGIGVKPQSISQYLDGASTPSYATLALIADFFHVSTDYLIGRSDVTTGNMHISALATALHLSENSVLFIQENSKTVDRLLSSEYVDRFFSAVKAYHDHTIPPKNKDLLMGYSAFMAQCSLKDASNILGDIFRAKDGEKSMLAPVKIEVIHGDPPPLQDDEVELVFEADEKTPSADELERMIVEKILKHIKDRGFVDG